MWPPGAVCRRPEQMIVLLVHEEQREAWDRRGLSFVTAWKEWVVAAAVVFPHMGVVGTTKWNVCVWVCMWQSKHWIFVLSSSQEPISAQARHLLTFRDLLSSLLARWQLSLSPIFCWVFSCTVYDLQHIYTLVFIQWEMIWVSNCGVHGIKDTT